MIGAHHLRRAGHGLAEGGERAIGAMLEVMGIERKSQHPAPVSQRADDGIGFVAQRRVPCMGVGMGDGDGPGARLDGIQRRAFGGMTHIDDQPDAVHLGDHRAAHAGQAGIFILVTAGREQGLVVIGQLHEPCAQRMQDLDKADIVFDGRGVLETEDDGGAPRLPRPAHILPGAALNDQIGIALEPAVPLLHVQDRLAKGFVIGDGHMHRIDTALAHLAKDGLRPIGVLQAVDAMGAGHGRSPHVWAQGCAGLCAASNPFLRGEHAACAFPAALQ